MNKTIDFTKQYEFQVDVFEHEHVKLGSGTLKFEPECWIQVNFGVFEFGGIPEGKEFATLKAVSQSGEHFTLFQCKRIGFGISANYVATGDVGENFKNIEIRYSDASEWYLGRQWLEGDVADTMRWNKPVTHFAAAIKTEQKAFALSSRAERSVSRTGEDHIFHEHVLFCLECHDAHFPIEDIKTKAMDLLRLLSILIAHPVTIISIQAVCEKGNSCTVFFPTYSQVERGASENSRFLRQCFIQQQDIHNRWESILNRYFNSSYREVSWTRLAGMQRYEGFWEYRALGYVSLLDKYVSQRYKDSKLPSGVRKEVKTRLREVICLYSPQLAGNQRSALMGRLVKAFDVGSFGEKFQNAISESDEDMMKIINITKGDFKRIKDVRDKIAHGDALGLSEDDFARTQIIVNKIILLMTYWAYMDFGLNNEDFLRCLDTTHHDLRLRAEPDTTHMARKLRPDTFFAVSKEDFDKLSSNRRIQFAACFLQHNSGAIEYSEKYSGAYQAWMTSPDRTTGQTKHSEMFGVAEEQIKYWNSLYVSHGEGCIKLSAAWIIQDSIPISPAS